MEGDSCRQVELGAMDFVQMEIKNPTDKPVLIKVTISDPDLKVVDRLLEDTYFKIQRKLPLTDEPELFLYSAETRSFQMFGSRIRVPLKYQTFNWPYKDGRSSIEKEIEIMFTFLTGKKPTNLTLSLNFVVSLPITCENFTLFKDFATPFRSVIKVPRLPMKIDCKNGKLRVKPHCFAYCTDPSFKLFHHAKNQNETSSTIFIQDETNSRLIQRQIFIFVYPKQQMFRIQPIQTWCINVITPLPVRFDVTLGTTHVITLAYDGGIHNRVLKCCSSPCEFMHYPTENITVIPNELNTVSITVEGISVGRSVHAVELIDVNNNYIACAWTVRIDCDPTEVTTEL